MAEEQSIPVQDDLPLDLDSAADAPLDLETGSVAVSPKSMENIHKSNAAILKSYNTEENVLDSYMSLLNDGDPRQKMRELSAQKADIDAQDYREVLEQDPGSSELEVLENAGATQELITEAYQAGSDPAKQVVDAASVVGTDESIAKKIEGQLRMMEDIQDMMSNYDTLDIAWDVVKGFMPGKLTVDNKAITGQFFGGEDVMRDIILGFKSKPIEEQLRDWPVWKELLFEELPEGRAIGMMAKFLDPLGEEQLEDFGLFWQALDVVDLAATGAAVAITMARLSKQLNAIKMMADLNNQQKAADVNAAAMMDSSGEVAAAANIDQVTAYSNSAPFNMSKLDEGWAAGLSAETQARILAVRENQARTARNIIEEQSFVKEDLLSPEARNVAEADYAAGLTASGFEDVHVVGRKAGSTEFSYSLVLDGERLEDVGKLELKIDMETGFFENTPGSLIKNLFASPSVTSKGTAKEAFNAAARMDASSPKVANDLRLLQAEAMKPLLGTGGLQALLPGIPGLRKSTRQKIAELDDVLLHGDSANKVYTAVELKSGINGTKLDDVQIETYFNLRGIYDNLFVIRNAEKRKEMTARGLREVQAGGGPQVGRVHESLASAQASLRTTGAKTIWHDAEKTVLRGNRIDLEKLYEQGYVLTRLDSPMKVGKKGEHYQSVITRRNQAKDLPEAVLHFKQGYVPKVNKNAYWFVKEAKTILVDGTQVTNKGAKTIRMFNNKHDADLWTAQQTDKNLNIFSDREMEQQVIGSSGISSGGGLYTGPRAKAPIPFGLDGRPAERFGAFEALSQNINSLQNYVSRNEWRMGMEQKWINSVKAAGIDNVDRFDPRLMPDTPAGIGLKELGEQIQEWSGFNSKSERLWDATVSDAVEWAMNSGLSEKNTLVRGLHFMRHRDPVSAARAAAFHVLLGSFTPVQTWVQAQGASIAISVAATMKDPLIGARAIKNQMFLKLAGDGAHSEKYLDKLATLAAVSRKDLDEMVELWNKSGFKEGVLQTADHAASSRSHGIAMDALKRTADKGLFFYRAGELFNRRTSFLVALDEFKQANKGVKVGNKEMKKIMTRANDFMLNLSKANRAQWQKGIASLPTQFLQVQAKTMESLLGVNGKFTRGERAKLAMGQLALYGTAGVPLSGLALRWFAEMNNIEQADVEQLDPLFVKAINEGFWGAFFLTAFDADVEVGTRGGAASGMTNFINDLLFTDAPISEKIMGAFGTVPHRAFNAFNQIKPIVVGQVARKDFSDIDDYKMMVGHLGSIASSWSNANKAVLMRNFDLIKDRNNYPVVTKDFNPGTELLTAIGFQPSIQRKVRDLQTMNKEMQEYRKNVTNSLFNSYWNYTREIETAENEREEAEIIQKYEIIHAALLQSMPSDNDRRLVSASMKLKLNSPSKESREIKKWLQNFADGRQADRHAILSQMNAQGLIQVTDIGEEE